ncbi:nuclear protein quality control by the ubiquitin-proteasome system protein [Malassezia pachydermatis]|uniref:Tethering factor for nuclear proteasome STS1 n=1 Tax=Malassezia pachydermatis TaxID=77020 RepID=A0A0M8ML98_9BASI|nr:nuclear cut8 family protein [Malassezia pachydermatis]KOS13838.1 nuclear cut8 family protein [Malassezia pachydermatis]
MWGTMENSIVTPPPRTIPFNTPALHHVPPALSFGFGCGSVWGETHTSPALAAEAPQASHMSFSPARMMPSQETGRPGHKRRRNSMDNDADVDDESDMLLSLDDPAKRRRAGRTCDGHAKRAAPSHGGDIGRSLATLEKSALLTILLELAKDESTAERIYTLLPAPTVENALASLQQYESRIRSSLPMSTTGHVREQYVWGRVRSTLDELASDLARYLSLFSPSRQASRDMPPIHPTEMFSFLHTATQCMLRIAHMLPCDGAEFKRVPSSSLVKTFRNSLTISSDARDPMAHTIIPMLLREWQAWLVCMDAAVNKEARMYGQEVVLSWCRGLAMLSTCASDQTETPTEAAVHAAMHQAAEQMHTSIGWLVGPAHRAAWDVPTSHTAMDEGDGA